MNPTGPIYTGEPLDSPQPQIRRTPKRPDPSVNHTGSELATSSNKLAVGKLGLFIFILVIIAGALSLVLPSILDYIGTANSADPVHIENKFLDIDSDGDQDFVIKADVLLNCAGSLCQPAPAPTASPSPALPAAGEQAGQQQAVPTPEIVNPDG